MNVVSNIGVAVQVVINQARENSVGLSSDWLTKSLYRLIGCPGVAVRVEITKCGRMV